MNERQNAIFNALGAVKENQIEVTASTTGTILRNGCVFAPGAFTKAALNGFLKDGAILVGHDWDDLPIGMPVSAKIVGNELVSVAQFHGTEAGQDARTIAKERMDAGLSVSVSIGFMPEYQTLQYFNNGAEMVKAMEDAGEDMTAYDVKGIKAYKYQVHMIRTVTDIYEWSIVLVGANQRAKARQVNSLNASPAHGLGLEEHLEISLAGIQRSFDVAKLRQESGRHLSEDRLAIIRQIHEASGNVLDLSEPKPEPENDEPATDAHADAIKERAQKHIAKAKEIKDKSC